MNKEAWPWSRETGTWRDEGQGRGGMAHHGTRQASLVSLFRS